MERDNLIFVLTWLSSLVPVEYLAIHSFRDRPNWVNERMKKGQTHRNTRVG